MQHFEGPSVEVLIAEGVLATNSSKYSAEEIAAEVQPFY